MFQDLSKEFDTVDTARKVSRFLSFVFSVFLFSGRGELRLLCAMIGGLRSCDLWLCVHFLGRSSICYTVFFFRHEYYPQLFVYNNMLCTCMIVWCMSV